MWLGNNLHVCVCVCVSECVYINMNPSRYVSPIFPTFPTFPSFPSFHISLLAPLLKNLFGPPISSCTETNKQNQTKQKKKTNVCTMVLINTNFKETVLQHWIYLHLINSSAHTRLYIFHPIFFLLIVSQWSVIMCWNGLNRWNRFWQYKWNKAGTMSCAGRITARALTSQWHEPSPTDGDKDSINEPSTYLEMIIRNNEGDVKDNGARNPTTTTTTTTTTVTTKWKKRWENNWIGRPFPHPFAWRGGVGGVRIVGELAPGAGGSGAKIVLELASN